MSNNIARLTIPMEKTLRSQLKKRATELGFDSSQALLRYVSKAVVDERRIEFGEDSWGEPPTEAIERWSRELSDHKKLEKAGKIKSYTDTNQMMKDLLQ